MSGVVKLVSLGIGVLLAVSGSIAALAANTDSWETHRVAAANFDRALSDAEAARLDAIDRRRALLGSMARADNAIAEADRLIAGADPLDVAALPALVAALRKADPDFVPSAVSAPDETTGSDSESMRAAARGLDRWSANTLIATAVITRRQNAVDVAADALAEGVRSVARTVPAAAIAGKAAAPLASAAQRDQVSRAVEAVTSALRSGTDPFESILAWSRSAVALRDAQAAAAAAAAVAAAGHPGNGGQGGGAARSDPGGLQFRHIDLNNPPTVIFDGNYVGPYCAQGSSDNWVSQTLSDGEVYYFSDPNPYEGRVLAAEDLFWALIVNGCL